MSGLPAWLSTWGSSGKRSARVDRLVELVAAEQYVVGEPAVPGHRQPPLDVRALQPARVRLALDEMAQGAQIRAARPGEQPVQHFADPR